MKLIKKAGLILISSMLLVGCAKEELHRQVMDTYSYEEDKSSYTLENDHLKFTLDPDTTYFQVLNKSNNVTWDSNPVGGADDAFADNQSKKYLQSTLLIEYCNDTGIRVLYNNYEYSILKRNYNIEQGEGYIEVNYTIGNVEQVFLLPVAAPESRMKEFMDRMEASDQKKINTYYRKIDIAKLRATDNKADLIARYPDIEQEPVYELRDGTQGYLKKKIEDLFSSVGYTREDYEEDKARYSKVGSEENPYFNVSILYRLEGDELVVELPFEAMDWSDRFPLTKVNVLPYMGAGSTEDTGFILVPEGNGGIINFNNGRNEQSAYYTEVYGWDDGMERDYLTDDNRSDYPVFGISKNGSSMLCILEDYNSVASISADISSRNHSYNYASATYTTLHAASISVSAKTDKSVMVYEAKKPEGTIRQRYRFMESSSYGMMAKAYRDYLMAKNPSLKKIESSSTPINITLIGAIDKVEQRLGFPVSVPLELTSYQEAYDIIDDLKEAGYHNLSIRYSGWMNGGTKQKLPTSIKTVSELGSKSKFKKFLKHAEESGVPVYLESMTQYAYNKGLFDGFVINRDGAKYSSRKIIKLYNFSKVYFGEEDWKDCFYLLKPQVTIDIINKLSDYAEKNSANLAFTDIGFRVSADYNPKNLVTRQQAIELQKDELKKVSEKGTDLMVSGGNDYVLPYVAYINDMKLRGNKYHLIDELVPFYTMAIHGLVEYSGSPLNLSRDYREEILQSAESGAGLSFTFMKESTSILQDSFYTYLFGADYDLWKDEAYSIYSRFERELGHCYNQFITEHGFLADGVTVTAYEDGTKVYVNYNDTEFNEGDIRIPARDFKVERR
ncbi:hypothetical protein HNQ56_000518 [Anaerotaenia torta]|uniref:DUF5696 domain-containing protein n=1 Tax=Anaerotaenia torta TaxID=433293 RepID=UPI003D194BFA